MTYITQGRDLCCSRTVCCRVLIKTLPIAMADDKHNAQYLTIVCRHDWINLGEREPTNEVGKRR